MPISRIISPMEGTMVRAHIEFLDDTKAPADPSDVTVHVLPPGGPSVEVGSTQIGVGVYVSEFVVDVPGKWVIQAAGTGALVVVEEQQFSVRNAVI